MSYYGILPLGIPNQPTMNHYGCSAQLSLPKPVGTPCIKLYCVKRNIQEYLLRVHFLQVLALAFGASKVAIFGSIIDIADKTLECPNIFIQYFVRHNPIRYGIGNVHFVSVGWNNYLGTNLIQKVSDSNFIILARFDWSWLDKLKNGNYYKPSQYHDWLFINHDAHNSQKCHDFDATQRKKYIHATIET